MLIVEAGRSIQLTMFNFRIPIEEQRIPTPTVQSPR